MKYLFFKSLYDIKKNMLKFLVFLIAYVLLIIYFINTYKSNENILISILYGFVSLEESDLFIILFKLFKIALLFYIFYVLFSSDLLYSKANIFLRISLKKWVILKSLFALIIIIGISLGLMGLFLKFCPLVLNMKQILKYFLFLFNMAFSILGFILSKKVIIKGLSLCLLAISVSVLLLNGSFNILIGLFFMVLGIYFYNYFNLNSKNVNFS